MGIAILLIGLVLFVGTHTFVACRAQRAALIARIGEGAYRGLFSIVSILGVALIGYGYGEYRVTGWVDVWYPPAWTRHIVVLLMWPASICFIAPYFPGHIKATLKHPMLVGIKLWAVAHLFANGDLGSIILFGAILAWAVVDRISLKRRSNGGGLAIPFGGRRNDMIAIVAGTILYFLLGFMFHPMVVGVAAFGTPAHGI